MPSFEKTLDPFCTTVVSLPRIASRKGGLPQPKSIHAFLNSRSRSRFGQGDDVTPQSVLAMNSERETNIIENLSQMSQVPSTDEDPPIQYQVSEVQHLHSDQNPPPLLVKWMPNKTCIIPPPAGMSGVKASPDLSSANYVRRRTTSSCLSKWERSTTTYDMFKTLFLRLREFTLTWTTS